MVPCQPSGAPPGSRGGRRTPLKRTPRAPRQSKGAPWKASPLAPWARHLRSNDLENYRAPPPSPSGSKRGTMEAKQYAAVLTGAMRRLTEEDTTITAERIKQEVFPEASLEGAPPSPLCSPSADLRADVTKLFEQTMKLLQQAVKDNSEPAELEAALNAAKLTPVQLDTFVRFWKVQRAKVSPRTPPCARSSLSLPAARVGAQEDRVQCRTVSDAMADRLQARLQVCGRDQPARRHRGADIRSLTEGTCRQRYRHTSARTQSISLFVCA